jgi:hypothetical protein
MKGLGAMPISWVRTCFLAVVVLLGARVTAEPTGPVAGKEMAKALAALDQSLGLESYPEPHCLKWGYHQITAAEVSACADKAVKDAALAELGKSYVVAILMSAVGPQTLLAVALDAPGWAVLSCDPGKPCPPRRAGPDKMGKRVVDRLQRACSSATTIWLPEKKGCPKSAD